MKLHIVSDLHLEFFGDPPYGYELPDVGADVVVLAGDIGVKQHGARWAARESARLGKPFIYICGNHEFYRYRDSLFDTAKIALAAASEGRVHLLECGEVQIAGVRFLGATLWTDFELFGKEARSSAEAVANATLNDYRLIKYTKSTRLTPRLSRVMHLQTREWLEERLVTYFAGPTVVVTHHAPLRTSIEGKPYRDDLVSAAYASHLDSLFDPARVALWVHGHTHLFADYFHRGVRVVCNARGHKSDTSGFRPDFMVEVRASEDPNS